MFRKLMSLFHKVDHLRQQTDSLNELIYGSEVPSERDFCRQTFGMTPRQCERLSITLLKYQDEELGPFAVRRLEHLLNKDPKAMNYFLDFQQLTAMLILYFRAERNAQTSALTF